MFDRAWVKVVQNEEVSALWDLSFTLTVPLLSDMHSAKRTLYKCTCKWECTLYFLTMLFSCQLCLPFPRHSIYSTMGYSQNQLPTLLFHCELAILFLYVCMVKLLSWLPVTWMILSVIIVASWLSANCAALRDSYTTQPAFYCSLKEDLHHPYISPWRQMSDPPFLFLR